MKQSFYMIKILLFGLLLNACEKNADTTVPGKNLDIEFSQLTNITCNQEITVDGVVCSFVETTAEDCGAGYCSYGAGIEGIWLYPSRFKMDLSSSKTLVKASIGYGDYCGSNCTNIFSYDKDGKLIERIGNDKDNDVNGEGVFELIKNLSAVKTIAVSSCEGKITSINLSVE